MPPRWRRVPVAVAAAAAVVVAGALGPVGMVGPVGPSAANAQGPVTVGPPVTVVDGSAAGDAGASSPVPPVTPAVPPTLPPVPVGVPVGTVPGTVPPVPGTVPPVPGTVPPVAGSPDGAPVNPGPVPGGASTTAAPGPPGSPRPGPARTAAELSERVRAILATAPGSVSALVTIDGIGRVVDIDSTTARPPASTLKVLTAGTALLTLGAEHRFVTAVRATGALGSNGVLLGDLVLVGGGDPTLTTADLAGLAAQVAAAGVRTVNGRLAVDDARYDQMSPAVGWKPSFLPGEVGRVSAFLVDGNRRNEADPSVANLQRLRTALSARGVTVGGALVRSAPNGESRVVAVRSSQPLADIVVHMLKKSDNTDAEVVLREIGALSGVGSLRNGIDGVERTLDRFGLARPVLHDGSGLSSANRVSADLLVSWLTVMAGSKAADAFRTALPTACVDGTLKGRMCNTSAAGNLRAKTGYINNVVTLAGYATTAGGRTVTFAVLGSGLRSVSTARTVIDRAMVEVTSSLL